MIKHRYRYSKEVWVGRIRARCAARGEEARSYQCAIGGATEGDLRRRVLQRVLHVSLYQKG